MRGRNRRQAWCQTDVAALARRFLTTDDQGKARAMSERDSRNPSPLRHESPLAGLLECGRGTANRCLTGWFFARRRSYARDGIASAGIATFSGHVAEIRGLIRTISGDQVPEVRCSVRCQRSGARAACSSLRCLFLHEAFFYFCTEVCELAVLSVFHANPSHFAACFHSVLLPLRFFLSHDAVGHGSSSLRIRAALRVSTNCDACQTKWNKARCG